MIDTATTAPVDKDEFCRTTYAQLVGALGLFVGDRGVAEELAQETLVRVLVAWTEVSAMENPVGWAYKVGFNLARSRFRRLSAERRAIRRLGPGALEAAGPGPNGIDLHAALAGLTRRQRQAVIGRYYLDLPVPELAEAMSCTPGTAKAHLRDGLRGLRAAGLDIDEEVA